MRKFDYLFVFALLIIGLSLISATFATSIDCGDDSTLGEANLDIDSKEDISINQPNSDVVSLSGDLGSDDSEEDISINQPNSDVVSLSGDLGSDDSLMDSDVVSLSYELDESIDDGFISTYDDLTDSDVSLNDYQSEFINESTRSIDGPDLNDSFTEFKFKMTDTNTVYVNASFGENGNGTKLNPYNSLETAISSLSSTHRSASAISLANGIYNLTSRFDITKTFYIVGESAENTIISKNRQSSIFSIVGSRYVLNVFNLTLTGGKSHYGGAIYLNQSTLNVVNTIFKDNEAEGTSDYAGAGGAIYNEGGLCRIYNSTFINNMASSTQATYAGAIYNDLGSCAILNSRFINNSVVECTYGAGGAIYNFNSFLTVYNSSFINNSVYGNFSIGGAISSFEAHNVFVINSTIDSNNLYGNYTFAPAIFNKAALLEIIDSNISNNVAGGFSTANSTVFNIAGIYHLINSTMSNNTDFNTSKMSLLNRSNENVLMILEDQIITSQSFSDDELINLPSRYDLRDYGLVTGAKDQGYSGSCWAFAIYGALESYLLKSENLSYDFSENNLKNVMGNYGINGTDWTDGGNFQMALAYLLRWSGPVTESQDYYGAYSIIPNYIDEITKHVQEVMFVPLRLSYLDNNQIKAAILKYGALYTSIYGEDLGNPHYNSNPDIPNHAVLIVGWDDNYSANNFRGIKPPGNGAFIIKNSWGTSYGENGFGYVSYYDKTFAGYGLDSISALAFTTVENLTNYGNVYQYDILGNTYESIGYGSNTAWMANQFISESDSQLSAFGLYTYGDSDYLANIYVNDILKHSQSGKIDYAGYHTVKLNDLVDLAKGDFFRVEVRLTTFDSLFPIAIESQRVGYSSKANASSNQSFVSPDGIWWYDLAEDTELIKFTTTAYGSTLRKANVCLKAYTANLAELVLNVNSNSTFYLKDDLVRVSYNLTNIGDYASGIRLNFSLDDSLVIVKELCSCTKGLYNSSIGLWTIKELYKGESAFVNFVFNMSSKKEVVSIETFINCSSDALGNHENYTFNLYHDPLIRLQNNGMDLADREITTFARSNEEFTINLVNEFINPIQGKEFILSVCKIDGDLTDGDGLVLDYENWINISTLISNSNGELKLIFDLLEGNYLFNLVSAEDENYNFTNISFYVNAKRTGTSFNLDFDEMNILSLSDNLLSFGLYDEFFNLIGNSSVLLLVDDLSGNNGFATNISDDNGLFKFNLNLFKGNYSVLLSYGGNDYYAPCEDSFNVSVSKRAIDLAQVIEKNLYYPYDIKIKVLYGDVPLSKKSIEFNVSDSNGKSVVYRNITDSAGIVHLNGLSANQYNIRVIFSGDDLYDTKNLSFKVQILKRETKIIASKLTTDAVVLKSDKRAYLKAYLKDKNGVPLANKKVQIKLNNRIYNKVTNKNGLIQLEVNLAKSGNYKVVLSFAGDERYKKSSISTTIKVKPKKTLLILPKMSFKSGNKNKFLTATLRDRNKRAIASKKLTFYINGRTFVAKTNSKALAKVRVSLTRKGTYSMVVKFKGDRSYSAISKKSKVIIR